MDRLDVIATFVRVAELASFTAAATALGISRTVASDRVMQLEARLGVKLLNRTTRRVSLTEAGLAYLDRARLALTTLEEAEQVNQVPFNINVPFPITISVFAGWFTVDFNGSVEHTCPYRVKLVGKVLGPKGVVCVVSVCVCTYVALLCCAVL